MFTGFPLPVAVASVVRVERRMFHGLLFLVLDFLLEFAVLAVVRATLLSFIKFMVLFYGLQLLFASFTAECFISGFYETMKVYFSVLNFTLIDFFSHYSDNIVVHTTILELIG